MIKWIEKKWDWYLSLPWYWKILAFIPGLIILILIILYMLSGNKLIINNTSGSDKYHKEMFQKIKEDREKLEKELSEKSEKLKEQIKEIKNEEEKVEEKANKVEDKLEKAKSVDEIRKILKRRS